MILLFLGGILVIIKTYEEKYLDEIILMIKECILEINQEDYSQK